MSTSLAVRIVFWGWLLAAIAAGQSPSFQRLPLPAVQGILFGLTGLLVIAYRGIRPFRSWVDSRDLRGLVLLHATRVVGIYFRILYQHGELPYAFAVPGGTGDILVAAGALVVAFYPFAEDVRARAIYIWNVAGLVDILLVVFSALRIGLARPHELVALAHLPLSLLPTFLVPLIVATHLAIFARLAPAPDASFRRE
jgi:hypothetical protein